MIAPTTKTLVKKLLSETVTPVMIRWPNQSGNLPSPLVVFDHGVQFGTVLTTDGREAVDWRPQVSVLTDQGKFDTESENLLFSVASAFKVGTKIRDGNDLIVAECPATPVPQSGRPDGGHYRRDMILRIAVYQKL